MLILLLGLFSCIEKPNNPLDDDYDNDGFTEFDGDCDDGDASLNPRNEDGDGYSSCEVECSDLDPLVYTGVAYLEQDLLCMRDADGDGYGDSNPPARVSPGSDCDDTDANMGPFDADNDGMEECSIMLHLSMET